MILACTIEAADTTPRKLRFTVASALAIGRDPACDIVLNSAEVSRIHATVELTDGKLKLQDSSSNGTWAENRIVRRQTATLDLPCFLKIGAFGLHLFLASEQTVSVPQPKVQDLVDLRKTIHRKLLDYLDLAKIDLRAGNSAELRPHVMEAVGRILGEISEQLPTGIDRARLIEDISHEALGLGPLEHLLADDAISEIMVVDPETIFIERNGRIVQTDLRFTDDNAVRAVIERIVTPLGRRIDESSPIVDARLKDGSRVNAVIRPLAIRGTCITIRKFSKRALTLEDLISFGSMNASMSGFLRNTVQLRKNIVIAGGTGSGKTTLLNSLSTAIPSHERIVTIEDAAELRLQQPHVVSLETRPPNMEGKGEYSIRDLVKNALRMRPDRIIVGECRGGEALDMLQAMNTGHDGSMTTTHANSPLEALARLETLALMAGLELPARAIREQIAASVDILIQQTRFADGSRRITHISELVGLDTEGAYELHDIFVFRRTSAHTFGEVAGEFAETGYLPSFAGDFITHGLIGVDGELAV